MRFFILLSLLLPVYYPVQAQLITSPSFSENTLVNSPASIGALQQEGIKINTFSHFSKTSLENASFNNPTNITTIIPRSIDVLSTSQLKSLGSISYHNTQTLPNNFKVTVGLQVQLTSNRDALIYTPNTYGITANLHLPLTEEDTEEQYMSFGMQMNVIHQKPNRAVTAFTYDNLLSNPILDYDSFHNQFSKTGFQYTFNLSYLKHKYKKSIFAVGFSFGAIEAKLANSLNTSGSFRFDSDVNITALAYLNFQRMFGEKFMLDFNLIISNFEIATSVGIGFKLKKNKVIRITGTQRWGDFNSNSGGTIGFEMARCSYFFHISNRQQKTNSLFNRLTMPFSFLDRGTFAEFGVKYNMSVGAKPSLLNLKY